MSMSSQATPDRDAPSVAGAVGVLSAAAAGGTRYADWKAPDEDGQLLIWPSVDELLRQSEENRRRLSGAEVRVQGVALGELRSVQRRWLGHISNDQALIASGHQTELYHPGVWVKDVLVNAVARKVGGQGYHLAVDTDSPKHLHLRWPGSSLPITDDPDLARAAWTGMLDAPTPAHVHELESALSAARAGWDFEPMAVDFLGALRRLALEQPGLATALTNAIHQVGWELGLRHHALLTSPLWGSPPYLTFVYHVLARAGEFAGKYNAALAGYRREAGIVSAGRPMPDLQVSGESVEGAFWVDDLGAGIRRRLELGRIGGAWGFEAGAGRAARNGEAFVFDLSIAGEEAGRRLGEFLRARDLRIAPRALTLTMFFRLLVADQLVHGIGGGRYDQVTDRLIESFWGLEAPGFSVTTATLYFPAARGQRLVNLRPLVQEGRRLRHGSFSREKREMAARIAALPRRSRERAELFGQMHAKLAQQARGPRMEEWNRRLEEAAREQMKQKALFDRELFFAMQPRERLGELVGRYERVFG
jgi:hypothetical protein